MEYLLEWLLQIWDFMANFMLCLIRTGCIMRNIVLHIHIFLAVALIALVSGGCRDRHAAELLVRADSVMETAPDSALAILRNLNPDRMASADDKAYVGLLITQAEVKLNIPITSDSLIAVTSAYYTRKNPDSFDCMRALFYHSQVLDGLGNPSRSLALMLPAYNLAKRHEDPYWIAKTAEQMGMMYDRAYNDSLSLQYALEAAHYYWVADKTLNHRYALADAIPTLNSRGRSLDALTLGDSLLSELTDTPDDNYLKDYIMRKQLAAYINAGRYREGEECMRRLEALEVPGVRRVRQYLYNAQILVHLGDYEAARVYLGKAYEVGISSYEKILYFHTLSLYHQARGYYQEAIAVRDSMAALQDQYLGSVLGHSISAEEGEYYNDQAILNEARSIVWRNRVYMGVICGLFLLGGVVFMYRQKLSRKEYQIKEDRQRLEEAAEELSQLNNISLLLYEDIRQRDESLEVMRNRMVTLGDERDSLRNELTTLSGELKKAGNVNHPSLQKLFERQKKVINKICGEYLEMGKCKGKKDHQSIHYTNIQSIMEEIASPKMMKVMEGMIDRKTDESVKALRKSSIGISEEELKFIVLENNGFSISAIAVILHLSTDTLYKRKQRLEKRIIESNEIDKADFIALLHSKR